MSQSSVEDRPARLSVGVVGAGRVGAVLGAALGRAGHRVVAASAVSDASLARVEALLPGTPVVPPDEVLARADLVLLAVPDDALPGLVDGLVAADAVRPGQLLVHTSGRYGAAVLDEATRRGALPLALHPAMTFTGRGEDLTRLAGACFGVTAPDLLRPIAEALVVEMGGDPQWVEEDKRVLYHAALAGGANHLSTLVNESVDLLRQCGVEEPERMLAPLLGAALDNALRSGDAALTGPVARGDAGTVAAHLRELREVSPDTVGRVRRHGPADRRPCPRRRAAAPRGGRSPARRPCRRSPRPMTTRLVHTRKDLREAVAEADPGGTGEVGVVMSLGALHDGHRALIKAARQPVRPGGRHGLPQPAAVRAGRGPDPLPAHPRLGRRDLCARSRSTSCSPPTSTRSTPAGRRWCWSRPASSVTYSKARRGRGTSTAC